MAKQTYGKSYKLLELIRRKTDAKHPATQNSLRKMLGDEKAKDIMGDKGTYARRLKDLADAYNTDEDGVAYSKDQWKIIYPGYSKKEDDGKKNGKVYYVHPVSEEELCFLVMSIRNSADFCLKEKESFERRIREALGSEQYEISDIPTSSIIRECDESDVEKRKEISNTISELRKYIRNKKMIDMDVKIICDGKKNNKTEIHQVSPYRIVHKDGYYWLIANRHERPGKTCPDNSMYPFGRRFPWYTDLLTSYRIDLIREISQAHVPKKTKVKWQMTKALHVDSYIRHSSGRTERRARYGEEIRYNLDKYDKHASEISYVHCEDIFLK